MQQNPLLAPGAKVLITCQEWFFGADGGQYKCVYGTVQGIYSDSETLGVRTNARSANWYVQIGGMTIAGCQIFYVCQAHAPPARLVADVNYEAQKFVVSARPTPVWNADAGTGYGDSLNEYLQPVADNSSHRG